MKPIAYCRKSTDDKDRQVRSLGDQETELILLCHKFGITHLPTLKESRSGTKINRPIFDQMVKDIKKGKYDTIFCWKLDRLARNFVDAGAIIHLLNTGVIKRIVTPGKDYVPTDNALMLAVEFGLATQYSRDLSDNIRRSIKNKLLEGKWTNRAPLGYYTDKETRLVQIDKDYSKYITRIFYLYTKERLSMSEITKIMFDEGFRTRTGRRLYLAGISRILADPFYMGMMVNKGTLYSGVHAPLISKEVFDEARNIAEGKAQVRAQKLFFPLRGFLTCANCGCLLTATVQKGYHYYYCTNGKKICDEHKVYLREKDIYPLVAEELTKLSFTQRKIDLTYRSIQEAKNKPQDNIIFAEENLNKLITSITTKKNKLMDLFLRSSIDQETYDKKSLEFENELTTVNDQLNRLKGKKTSSTFEQVKNLFELANTMEKSFIEGKDPKKYQILNLVLLNATVSKGKILKTQYKSSYQLLANSSKNITISEMRRM